MELKSMSTRKGVYRPRKACKDCFHFNILYSGELFCMRHRKWLTPSKDNPKIPDNKQFVWSVSMNGEETLCDWKSNEETVKEDT